MTLPSLPLTLDPEPTLHFSNSQLELLMACQTMWGFKYLWRREKNFDPAPLVAGKAVHEAFEMRYKVVGGGPATPAAEAAMLGALHIGYEGVEPAPDEYRTEARFAEVIKAYNAHYGLEPFEVLGMELPLSAELGIVYRAYNGNGNGAEPIRVILNGIIDLLVRWDDGQVFVVDTKTMSQWGPQKQIEFENATGPQGYAWMVEKVAAEAIEQDAMNLTGNALKLFPKPALPPRVHGFALNAIVVRKESTSSRVKLPRLEFHRQRFFYSPERLLEWRRNALSWVQALVTAHEGGFLMQNRKTCANHYARSCPYLDVCTAPPEQRELVLGSDLFREVRKGPMELARDLEEAV